MSGRLWITDEVRDWLTGLRTRDPSAARLVGEAVVGLLHESPGPPLVVPADPLTWSDDPRGAINHAYQRQLELLQLVRRATADIATQRKRVELHIQQLESSARKLGDQSRMADEAGRHDVAQGARERQVGAEETLADLRRAYLELRGEEEKAVRAAQGLQRKVDDWRAHIEQVRAAYVVAQAQDTLAEALAEAGEPHDPAPHTAAARSAVDAFLDKARALEREHAGPPLPRWELRLGALTGHDLRFLFTVDPSGTVLLLAVGEGDVGWHEQGIGIADELRRDESGRDEGTPESFLEEFFPGEADERRAGAARLLALNRMRVLADVRRRRGLTQGQVAGRMNTTTEQVAAIESTEPGATQAGALAAYVEAIGGRLEIVADFGTEQVRLY